MSERVRSVRSSRTGIGSAPIHAMTLSGDDMSTDPRPFLTEVRLIVDLANRQVRDMTPGECERCDRLLDAAEALARLGKAGRMDALESRAA